VSSDHLPWPQKSRIAAIFWAADSGRVWSRRPPCCSVAERLNQLAPVGPRQGLVAAFRLGLSRPWFMQVLVVGARETLGRQIARATLDQGHQGALQWLRLTAQAFVVLQGGETASSPRRHAEPASLGYALEGQDAVIDAATARVPPTTTALPIDWERQAQFDQRSPARRR